MLDKSLPKINVLMVKPDVHTYPHFELPEGFSFSGYQPGMEEDWAQIQYGVFQYGNTLIGQVEKDHCTPKHHSGTNHRHINDVSYTDQ